MCDELDFSTLYPRVDLRGAARVKRFLAANGLGTESDIQVFVVVREEGRIVACAGLAEDVVKCVAIAVDYRGECLSTKLMNEIYCLAMERGQSHLFLYTKPRNLELFGGCGFYKLAEVPGRACLMENTPVGIKGYCESLRAFRQSGQRIGSIVLNANPFTLGHRYLVTRALRECDWLHVFVVSEDASAIRYADRFDLVRAGLEGLDRLTIHGGSRYLVSKATFPCYFLKDICAVDECGTAIDLMIFRNYIAPALGITHRFVGSEPICPLTHKYNEAMLTWLEGSSQEGPAIQVVEVPRLEVDGVPVSASHIRLLLSEGNFAAMAAYVPPTTLALLRARYRVRPATLNDFQEAEMIEVS